MTIESDDPLYDAVTGAFSRLKPHDLELIRHFQTLCTPERLISLFQPIFRAISGELEGCEALLRLPPEPGFASPTEAFHDAARLGFLLQLESAAIVRHFADVREHIGDRLLFLNVSAPLFSDPNFGVAWLVRRTADAGLSPEQVVLEIPEVLRIRDFHKFHRHLEPFRREGFRIAIDDFGAGFTNLRMITDLSPDFVKVDRVFIDGIASHARKRVLVESVVTLCHRVNCRVIAEGIELPDDLEACLAAGTDFLQGFLFARPTPAAEAFGVFDLALPNRTHASLGQDIRRLLLAEEPASPETPVRALLERFRGNARLRTIPIVEEGRAMGLVTRAGLDTRLAAGGPDEAGALEPVGTSGGSEACDRIPDSTLVEEAAELVRRRPEERRFDPFVVVGPSQSYRGLLEIDTLLVELARLKVEYALQSNPVTRLPGRLVFEPLVAQRLEQGDPFVVARLNLRRFKLYNDRYGFLRGDDLLIRFSSLLRSEVGSRPGTLVAHLANDDFAYVTGEENHLENANRLLTLFETMVRDAHDPEDIAADGFVVRDRRGEARKIPLVGLAIGLVPWQGEDGVGVRALLETAEATLLGARNGQRSMILLNRRSLQTANRISAIPAAGP